MNWFDEVDYGEPAVSLCMDLKDMSKNTPHTRPAFIALSGKKQVGKDTAANMIVKIMAEYGKKTVLTAFAEPLKRMCVEILGLKPEGVYGTDAQKNSLSHIMWDGLPLEVRLKYSNEFAIYNQGYDSFSDVPETRSQSLPRSGPMTNREVLQIVGTDIFRAMYDQVWAKAPFNRNWGDADVVILTDCRFPNEKSVTEDAGGVIIRLERSTGFVDNHPSEVALDGFTFENTYQNNGSFEDLENYVRGVLKARGLING
jgi:hypothetical protein